MWGPGVGTSEKGYVEVETSLITTFSRLAYLQKLFSLARCCLEQQRQPGGVPQIAETFSRSLLKEIRNWE